MEAGCAAVTFKLKVAVPFKTGVLESVTVIVTTLSPAAVGVPEITPVEGLIDKLAGEAGCRPRLRIFAAGRLNRKRIR